ncbi:MAG: DUF2130 domain-containing protein [Saprospiraceae bacterium]
MQKISCPACGHSFHAEEVIGQKLTRELEKQFQEKELSLQAEFVHRLKIVENKEKELESKKLRENEIFTEKLEKEKAKILEHLKIQQEKDYQLKLFTMENERKDMSDQLEKLTRAAIENEQLKRKMNSMQSQIELQLQQKLNEELTRQTEIIRADELRRSELKQKEYEMQLDTQRKLIDSLQRKSQQGSMQIQGEVQELAIENYLKEHFPLDEIEEVRKGARGADCVQHVNTRSITDAGTIYYESKRTKSFELAWIEKLKEDMRLVGADVGVLITQTMPKDMDHMGEKQGIWICSYDEYKALIPVLRHGLIQVAEALASQVNKADKMNMLYAYLTGNDFKMQIEAIVEGFKQMQEDLQKEKLAMSRIWAQREKVIEKVLVNTSQFYGSVKGIAGSAVPIISVLDLPG